MVFLDLNLKKTYNKVSREVLKKVIIEFDDWARVEEYN